MRVLCVGNMYPPHHLGGYELMWRAGAGALRDRGHAVRILTTDFRLANPDSSIPEDDDVHRDLRWYWREHKFPRLGLRERLSLERHNARTLDRHLEEHSPDVVCWWAMGGMSLSLVERVRRQRRTALGFVHDDWLAYGPRVDQWTRLGRRLGPLGALAERSSGVPMRLHLGDAARWIFVSESTRRRALEAGISPRRDGVIHSGVDLARFPLAPEREWGWRLAYVGRLDPRKGTQTAIRALAELPAQARLTVSGAGDAEHLQELKLLASSLGLGDRVVFTQTGRNEISELYAAADAVLFPVQWEEPWGLVPLEAMASGSPVIATGAGGSAEYLRDERNALLYSPADSHTQLAAAIARLAGDAPLRARLRQAGRATAEEITEARFAAAAAEAVEEEG